MYYLYAGVVRCLLSLVRVPGAAGVGFVVISKYLYSIESVTVKTSISLHMLTSKSELIWCLVDGNVFGVYACMPYQPSDRPNIIMIKKKRKNQQ